MTTINAGAAAPIDAASNVVPFPAPENVTLQWALWYASKGFHVLPLRGKATTTGLTPDGFKNATTDANIIRGWWAAVPDANIGIRTGKDSGITVLDVDGPTGRESVEKLQKRFPCDLNSTWKAKSGRIDGGEHHYFRGHTGQTNQKKYGLDVKSEGGFIVAPPSIHPDTGARYEWLNNCEMLPVPELVKQLAEHKAGLFEDRPAPRSQPRKSTSLVPFESYSDEAALRLWKVMEKIPGAEHDEWLQVGQACHWVGQFWGSQLMLQVWDHWSSTRPGYDKLRKGELQRRWDSFNADRGITVGTIYRIADSYGHRMSAEDMDAILKIELAQMNAKHFVLGNYGVSSVSLARTTLVT
jgi:hypothetical protein